nr:TMV resistance protein N-like [Tanacetum cinerariifolium]
MWKFVLKWLALRVETGMKAGVNDFVSLLEIGFNDVRMMGDQSERREVSKASLSGLKKLQKQTLSDVFNEHITLSSVYDGKNMMKSRMCGRKVLLVLDDVDHINQLEALAGEPCWFKPGSRVIITTRDEQVLVAHG